MACFLFLLFLVQYTIAITGLMRPQTAEDFSTILTSVSNNDDDDDVSAAAATPEKKLTAFTSDTAESSGGEPGSLPLVADVSCDSHASESFDNDDHIPYSFNIFRPWSSSGGRFARRQNQNKQFCPQPFVVPLNPTKAQQQQSRPGREPRLSDLLMEMSPVLTDDDEGPCKFIVAHKVAVCAQPSVPPRYSLVDTVDPCRLWYSEDPCIAVTEEVWCCSKAIPLAPTTAAKPLIYGYEGISSCVRIEPFTEERLASGLSADNYVVMRI